jgi:hypothetical protein
MPVPHKAHRISKHRHTPKRGSPCTSLIYSVIPAGITGFLPLKNKAAAHFLLILASALLRLEQRRKEKQKNA